MPSATRIGVLGLVHDHVWGNLDELSSRPSGVCVAAADPHEPLREQAKQRYGCAVYSDYEDLLNREQLDAVYLFGDNAANVGFTEMAASRGLHILVEKPLAQNLAGARRMLRAVKQSDVRLMVNWPFAWWPQLRRAIEIAQSGQLGHLWQVKYRAAHAGPKEAGCSEYFCEWLFDAARNGGGALIDYCCYGVLLAFVLLGSPDRVSGIAGRLCKEIPVEDNAVLVMSYPRAIAISEASWTQIGKLTNYVTTIFGSAATLLVEPRAGGSLILADNDNPDGRVIDVPQPPANMQSASAHFLHCLETDTEFFQLCRSDNCHAAQAILEAGQQSAQCGAAVALPVH